MRTARSWLIGREKGGNTAASRDAVALLQRTYSASTIDPTQHIAVPRSLHMSSLSYAGAIVIADPPYGHKAQSWMLDEVHGTPSDIAALTNKYIFGSLGANNIILVSCKPSKLHHGHLVSVVLELKVRFQIKFILYIEQRIRGNDELSPFQMEPCDIGVPKHDTTSLRRSPSFIANIVDIPYTKAARNQNGLTFLPLRGTLRAKGRVSEYNVYCKDESLFGHLTLEKFFDLDRESTHEGQQELLSVFQDILCLELDRHIADLQDLTRLAILGLLDFCRTFPSAMSQAYGTSSAAAWAAKFTTDSIAIAELGTLKPVMHTRSAEQKMTSYVYSHNIIGGHAIVHLGNIINHHQPSMRAQPGSGPAISTWGPSALCVLMVAYNMHKMNKLAESLDGANDRKGKSAQVSQAQTNPIRVSKSTTRSFGATKLATSPPQHRKHASRELSDIPSAVSKAAVDKTRSTIGSVKDSNLVKTNEQDHLKTAWKRAISLAATRKLEESATYQAITPTPSYAQPHRTSPNPPTPGPTWTGSNNLNSLYRGHTSWTSPSNDTHYPGFAHGHRPHSRVSKLDNKDIGPSQFKKGDQVCISDERSPPFAVFDIIELRPGESCWQYRVQPDISRFGYAASTRDKEWIAESLLSHAPADMLPILRPQDAFLLQSALTNATGTSSKSQQHSARQDKSSRQAGKGDNFFSLW
ncbi:hypothetical protein HII31_05792 [Pseudocercospora fuligena]|uniref:Uncharacterized protein n=1 Tax=Pseudocercospora fuligena TaxID=685502 RepID=A0A8H6RL61_9PEZI|nr:hypothetical protein HII31_05792 [Pseudocercospora fuligena]